MSVPKQEVLGSVKTTSGTLMLVDFGSLDMWCHDEQPALPEWMAPDPETLERANQAVDMKITGPDAIQAGKSFDRNWHPEYIYDIPRDGIEEMKELFNTFAKRRKWKASLNVLRKRIPHKKRVDLSLKFGKGIGEVGFQGVWGVVLGKLPKNKELVIYGERMKVKEWENYWRQVVLEILPDRKTKTSTVIGHVLVDTANILISDVAILNKLADPNPLDGLADVAFWGRDEQAVAQKVRAKRQKDNEFGWFDLSMEAAIKKGMRLHNLKEQDVFKFAFDFRPHSYNHLMYKQIRSSQTDSGVLEVEGVTACCFLTRWGDGAFPVIAEFDAGHKLARVRIDLGNKTTIRNMEYVRKKYG